LSLPYYKLGLVRVSFSLTLSLNSTCLLRFQAVDGRTHASGAIYISLDPLPRTERYEPRNTILVGNPPGVHEPSNEQLNHMLAPLERELAMLYAGMYHSVLKSVGLKSVRLKPVTRTHMYANVESSQTSPIGLKRYDST
jgi:hypothetical protein